MCIRALPEPKRFSYDSVDLQGSWNRAVEAVSVPAVRDLQSPAGGR